MSMDYKLPRHPSRQELLALAELLTDQNAPVPAALMSHVKRCEACKCEVQAMRRSYQMIAAAKPIEPRAEMTNKILMAAKAERRRQTRPRKQAVLFGAALRGTAYAAATLIVAGLSFGAALHQPESNAPDIVDVSASAAQQVAEAQAEATAFDLEKAAADVETLAAAVNHTSSKPLTLREREHRRAVDALNADLEAARAALRRNPGHPRASEIVNATLREQAATLRDLYLEREL